MGRSWLLLLLVGCEDPGQTRFAPRGPGLGAGLSTGLSTGFPSGATTGTPVGDPTTGPCPAEMAWIDDGGIGFCIDRYEAGLDGWSPYEVPNGDEIATVAPGVIPQGYISGDDAAAACANAGKRLCTSEEWLRACQGPDGWTFPYGPTEDPGACNTDYPGGHPLVDLFGADTDWSGTQMNDPGINQQPDTVDPSGANPSCVTPEGVYDLHGNLHEWVEDPSGVFRGGFYADAELNGSGCLYATTAHTTPYHDYSTGFRCCAD